MRWVLKKFEAALGSDLLIPILLGALVATERLDFLTGLVAVIAYVKIGQVVARALEARKP